MEEPLFVRACDSCKQRKIKCDRGEPCSACNTSGIACARSRPVEPKERKKRIHVSSDIDSRLRMIEERLQDIHRLVAASSSHRKESSFGPSAGTPGTATTATPHGGFPHTTTPGAHEDFEEDQDSDQYEGETSIFTQSKHARKLLEQVVGGSDSPGNTEELNKAIQSLQAMEDMQSKTKPKKTNSINTTGVTSKTELNQLPLPPMDAVIHVLRLSKERPTLTFATAIGYSSLDQITEQCKTVFFAMEPYSISTAITVHANLFYIFHESSVAEQNKELANSYLQYAEICKANMEAALSIINLLCNATPENIEALLLGAHWSIECSNTRRAWKLTTMAISLAQSLGWHRRSALIGESEFAKKKKMSIFWSLYVIDKQLALRLGKASILQDYDIDMPLPGPQYTAVTSKFSGLFQRWVSAARVVGNVYKQLYSPSALQQPQPVRAAIVKELAAEAERGRSLYLQSHFVDEGVPQTTVFRGASPQIVLQLMDKADEVQHFALLATLYRALPSARGQGSLNEQCIEASRRSMKEHIECEAQHREFGDDQGWSFYIHWTILQAPFTPFLVLFCNVLATYNANDLAMIDAFARSIGRTHYSKAAQKLHRMCAIFSQVANLYVKARKTTDVRITPQQHQPQITMSATPMNGPSAAVPASQTQPWGMLAPYVDAMNFEGDPMMEWGDMNNMNWAYWLQHNQNVLNILENTSPP